MWTFSTTTPLNWYELHNEPIYKRFRPVESLNLVFFSFSNQFGYQQKVLKGFLKKTQTGYLLWRNKVKDKSSNQTRTGSNTWVESCPRWSESVKSCPVLYLPSISPPGAEIFDIQRWDVPMTSLWLALSLVKKRGKSQIFNAVLMPIH